MNSRIRRGIAQLTEITIVLGIVMTVLTTAAIPLIRSVSDTHRNTVAAGQAVTVTRAVNQYIADNATAIAGGATASTPFILTVPGLVSAGYLPVGYPAQNNFSATYQTRIYQTASGRFHVMTFLSGGVRLSLSQARNIAIRIGAAGGYTEGGVAKGALGAWQEDLSAFGGFNPGDGHIVIAGFYQNGVMSNDYLYRKAVPGYPELNTMNTVLNMGGNDISNAATVTAVNAQVSHSLEAGTISAKGRMTSADTVQGRYLYPEQQVTAGAGCAPNGLIGRDGSGRSISCVNGRWAKNSGVPVGTIAIWGSENIPPDWLECNGQGFDTGVRRELARLYPSGTVPDFRGVFLRGLDRWAGRDPDRGRAVLSYQDDELRRHSHRFNAAEDQSGNSVRGWFWDEANPQGHRIFETQQTGGDETRPKNIGVIYIIRAQ